MAARGSKNGNSLCLPWVATAAVRAAARDSAESTGVRDRSRPRLAKREEANQALEAERIRKNQELMDDDMIMVR